MQMNMCSMKKGKTGSYVRDGMFVEVLGETDDSHEKVICRGVEIFDIIHKEGMVLSLFTMAGAMIPQSDQWTLGGHLKRIKKGEAKFGIGYVDVSFFIKRCLLI